MRQAYWAAGSRSAAIQTRPAAWATMSVTVPSKRTRPPSSTTTRSHSAATSSVWWVEMTTVDGLPGPAEHVAQPAALGRVQAGGRLVEDQQVRIAEHGLGEHHPASLATGQRADPLGGDVGQADQVDDPAYLVVPGRRARPTP